MTPRIRAVLLFAFPLLFFLEEGAAQQSKALLDQPSRWDDTRAFLKKDTLSPMGFKPWTERDVHGEDAGITFSTDTTRSLLHRKLFQESLFRVKEGPLRMRIDPLFDVRGGKDLADPTPYGDTTLLYKNQRGFHIQGEVGDRFSFSSRFRESQIFYPRYMRDYVGERGIVPGQGRVKPFKETGFDHSMVGGRVSYRVAEAFSITAGHGKHFIGEGYRSMLLSDNAFNYPFLELEHEWWDGRIAYRNLYTGFSSLDRMPKGDAPESLFKPKAGTIHYLDVRITPWMRLGLFEATMRQRWNDSTGVEPIEASTLSPVIFSNTLVQGFDSEHNVLTGADLRAKVSEHLLLYGQFVLDDPGRNRYGYQVGARGFDLGIDGLDLLVEYNDAAKGSFTHSDPLQHYGHYGQPLAHPLGTDFHELVARSDLRIERFFVRLGFNYAERKPFGRSGIVEPGRPRPYVEGPNRLLHQRASVGLTVNPESRMELAAGVQRRVEKGAALPEDHETLYLHLTLRTSLGNSYTDL